MGTKTFIYIGAGVGGILGSVLGGMLDHGNFFGGWGMILSGVGGIVGVWAGYKLGQSFGE